MKNPLLNAPEVQERFEALPADSRQALKAFCRWLYLHARAEADRCWNQSKAPLAVYWKAVAAWSYHLSRTIKL